MLLVWNQNKENTEKIKELEQKIEYLMKNQEEQNRMVIEQNKKLTQLSESYKTYNSLDIEDLRQVEKESLYPTKLEIHNNVCSGKYLNGYTLYDTEKAVKLEITINSTVFPKDEVLKSVRECCQKAIKSFY